MKKAPHRAMLLADILNPLTDLDVLMRQAERTELDFHHLCAAECRVAVLCFLRSYG
jgi:hypothetical protein